MQGMPLTTPTKMYMCVLQHRCAERYMLNVQQSRLLLHKFCCITMLGHISNSTNEDQYIYIYMHYVIRD